MAKKSETRKSNKAQKARSPKQGRAQKPGREDRPGNGSDYQRRIKQKKMAEGDQSKKGCLPKLFMLLLPFMVVGAYLYLRS